MRRFLSLMLAALLAPSIAGCITTIPTEGAEMTYQVCLPDPAARPEAVGERHPIGETVSSPFVLSSSRTGQRVLEGSMHINNERLLVRIAGGASGESPRVYVFRVASSMSSAWTGWAMPIEMGHGSFPGAMKDYDAYRPLARADYAKAPRMRWRTVKLFTGRTYKPTPIPPC